MDTEEIDLNPPSQKDRKPFTTWIHNKDKYDLIRQRYGKAAIVADIRKTIDQRIEAWYQKAIDENPELAVELQAG